MQRIYLISSKEYLGSNTRIPGSLLGHWVPGSREGATEILSPTMGGGAVDEKLYMMIIATIL